MATAEPYSFFGKEYRIMDAYRTQEIGELLCGNPYPGRGLIAGTSADGRFAAAAYFIMGRSSNSRNRIFVKRDGAVYTSPFDQSKVEDPSLILYAAVKEWKNRLILTNGDQTDTIVQGLSSGKTFEQALESRMFEPDAPNLTPRISAMLTFENGGFDYRMSILKSVDGAGTGCVRYTFSYPSVPGLGHFLHTYETDGNPLPPFFGEPERIRIPDGMDGFAESLWNALDERNRISLYVRFTDLSTGTYDDTIINRNKL